MFIRAVSTWLVYQHIPTSLVVFLGYLMNISYHYRLYATLINNTQHIGLTIMFM